MNRAPLPHAPQTGFAVEGDCLLVGGMPLTRLAERVGSTPFYAYDRGLLSRRVALLRAALPPGIGLHYSVKANPMPAVVQHMAGLVDGLDVASGGELKIALDTPLAAQHISFAGPGKTDAELRRAIAAGVVLNLESVREAERAAAAGAALGIQPRVMLRVNPEFELKASGMRMGGGARQFGVDAELAPQALHRIGALGLDFRGLHIFAGSQSLNAEAICQAQAGSFDLALRLAQVAPAPLATLNIGGGFGIPYFPGEQALDLAAVAAHLELCLARHAAALGGTRVALELGRYLVGEGGIYVTRIVERKLSRGLVFLVTDGGMNHHLAASGNLGQVIRKNYPVVIGNRMGAPETEPASVVGPLCTPLDLLADRMPLARAEAGDLVVVFQSGAYGPSASPGGFLSHPAPPEVLV